MNCAVQLRPQEAEPVAEPADRRGRAGFCAPVPLREPGPVLQLPGGAVRRLLQAGGIQQEDEDGLPAEEQLQVLILAVKMCK